MESTITIQNTVASITLAEDFDLHKIKIELDGTYNKVKFSGFVYRAKDPKAVFLIFIQI
jgi:transcription initiation factor TFIID TATA-box-binding protein